MLNKIVIFAALYCIGLSSIAQTVIKNNDTHLHYMGRVQQLDTVAAMFWSGTTVSINFNGTGVKAVLNDERGDNFYNIILDGKVIRKFNPEKGKKEYTLVADLPAGKHVLELFKRTEWTMGKTLLYNFTLNKGAELLPATHTRKRKIEFFGNSITCGMAVEDSTGQDRGSGPYENNYVSYAATTARHFDAEYYCIARSGIGVTVSWFPLIMPEMYDRLDPSDANSKWDFSKYTPDLVVVNLFQNDSWIVTRPDNTEFKARFGTQAPSAEQIVAAYRDFIKSVRGKYKNAKIICALGNMDATKAGAPWPGYIEQAVASLNDKSIYTHFFSFKNTAGHPNVAEQQVMARDLIQYIEQNVKW